MPLTSPKPLPSQTSSLAPWISEVHDLLSPAAGPWTDFSSSFVVTATTTNPTKGSSTYSAGYAQIGKTVFFGFKIQIGAGFVAGSGAYRFKLPVKAAQAAVDRGTTGDGLVNDSGFALREGSVTLFDVNNATYWYVGTSATLVGLDHSGPGSAWATSDTIQGSITYEAA